MTTESNTSKLNHTTYTKPSPLSFLDTGFSFSETVQKEFPLPRQATGAHSLDQLQHRHMVIRALDAEKMYDTAEKFRRCQHPDEYRVMTCPEHPEDEFISCPHSCGLTSICPECAAKNHREIAGRWIHALREFRPHIRRTYRPYHIILTTPHWLGDDNVRQSVADTMNHTSQTFRRYFEALSKVARYLYARSAYKAHDPSVDRRTLTMRLNALKTDEIARALWLDLIRAKKPHWWRLLSFDLSQNNTLKKLGIGALYGCEFGEDGQKLHVHALYVGPPINYEIFRRTWTEVTGFTVAHFRKLDDCEEAVSEVTKYATKLTSCPVSLVPSLFKALEGQRRIRAIGAFHGLIQENPEELEPPVCSICGQPLKLVTEETYQSLLIKFKAGDKSNQSHSTINGAHAPPAPHFEQMALPNTENLETRRILED